MKYVMICCCLLLVSLVNGQERHRRDTVPFGQWKEEITRVPVLTGGSQPIIIVPNRQQYCFDKQLYLKMQVGRMDAEQSIYLDTHNGLTGILPPSRGGAVLDIMPEIEHFNFTVMSMKGNVYIYKNQKGRTGIEFISIRTKKAGRVSSIGCILAIHKISCINRLPPPTRDRGQDWRGSRKDAGIAIIR